MPWKILRYVHDKFEPTRTPGLCTRVCNLVKDPRDSRDRAYAFSYPLSEQAMPDIYIISKEHHSYVKNQGSIGSCASHVAADLVEMEFSILKPNLSIPLSERWHYFNVRQKGYMDTFPEDSGQYLREMCKVLVDKGIAPEMTCEYNSNRFNEKPGLAADVMARMWKISSYHKIYSTKDIMKSIALNHPVAIGMRVFDSFIENKEDIISMPTKDDKSVGGHAVLVLGYNKLKDMLLIKNSWGRTWGDKGYAWVPCDYLNKHGFDYWSIRLSVR